MTPKDLNKLTEDLLRHALQIQSFEHPETKHSKRIDK